MPYAWKSLYPDYRLIKIARNTVQPRHVLEVGQIKAIQENRIHALAKGHVVRVTRSHSCGLITSRLLVLLGSLRDNTFIQDLKRRNAAASRRAVALVFAQYFKSRVPGSCQGRLCDFLENSGAEASGYDNGGRCVDVCLG